MANKNAPNHRYVILRGRFSLQNRALPQLQPKSKLFYFLYKIFSRWLNEFPQSVASSHDLNDSDKGGKNNRAQQCDQIWLNFASLAQFKKYLATLWGLVFGKLLNLLWKSQCPFGLIYVVVNGQILSKHFRHLVTLHGRFHLTRNRMICAHIMQILRLKTHLSTIFRLAGFLKVSFTNNFSAWK